MLINFYRAETDDDYAAPKLLFEQYAGSIGISLEFQCFDAELTGLRKDVGQTVWWNTACKKGGRNSWLLSHQKNYG